MATIKHTFLTRLLSSIFPYKVIENCDHDPYLARWFVIKTKWFGIYIHKFIRSDEDRALHDHPWPFIVIPLWRGYWEHYAVRVDDEYVQDLVKMNGEPELHIELKRRVWPILGIRFRRALFRHRVELLNCHYEGQLDIEERCPRCEGSGELSAWSFFIRFQREREWGFHPPSGFVTWKEWWKVNKCD